MPTETKEGTITFNGHVSAIRTSMGSWKVVLDIFEADLLTAAKLPAFYQKNVSAALVILPEE